MNTFKSLKAFLILLIAGMFMWYFGGCNESISTNEETDDGFLKEVVQSGTGSQNTEDDDLMSSERTDLDDGGAIGGDTPIDSLIKWGRRITGVSVTVTITNEGDSLKNVSVTRTITGNYIIVGMVNNQRDSIVKPYTEVLRRTGVFKRVANSPRPRLNWKVYKISMVDGQTTTPQVGSDYVRMNEIDVYLNGTLAYTFMGPDFTQNIFTTKRFGGDGIPRIHLNDNVRLVVKTYSTQSETDIVAWHWARNTFGFHREPFALTSSTPNGSGWDRVYEKSFTVNNQVFEDHLNACGHHEGIFNGFISASTHKSLYDDSPAEFASDLAGAPYRIVP